MPLNSLTLESTQVLSRFVTRDQFSMRTSSMNSQIGFRRRLAFAAVFSVLLASPVLAENFSKVQGSFNGYGVGIVQGGTLLASDSGSGAASQIAKFTFTMLQMVDLATQSGSGSFLLVFPSGDVIYGSLS